MGLSFLITTGNWKNIKMLGVFSHWTGRRVKNKGFQVGWIKKKKKQEKRFSSFPTLRTIWFSR